METASATTTLSGLPQRNISDDSTVYDAIERVHKSALTDMSFDASGASFVAQVRLPSTRHLDDSQRTALVELIQNANRLLRSGDTAEPIVLPRAVKRVIDYLALLVAYSQQTPQLYPLADRGVLVRWVRDGDSVDVEFDADGDVVALLTQSGQRRAGYLHQMWPAVTHWFFMAANAAA